MDISKFCAKFDKAFPKKTISSPFFLYENKFLRRFFDPCPTVEGMLSVKKSRLLNIAFSCINVDECYLEVGTYLGKSLISAMVGNLERTVFACDNFSEFTSTNSFEKLMANLRRYHLEEKVTVYNADLRETLSKIKIPVPVGTYFYDGAHDEVSQYLAIKNVEMLLSKEALVIIDDWRFAEDSKSYAKIGTEKAIGESVNQWKLLYNLPARYNGDHATWWNGVCVFYFRRRK